MAYQELHPAAPSDTDTSRRIYLDNHATTRTDPDVRRVMLETEDRLGVVGNTFSDHVFGRAASAAVERARCQVAAAIGVHPDTVHFTSGATESNNEAIRGLLTAERPHLAVSAIEHSSVLETAKKLAPTTVIPVDADGLVHPEDVERSITPWTALVAVMAANNEVGTIQPIQAIHEVCQRHGVPLLVDASQAVGRMPLVGDLITVSGHKINAPQGVGALYVRPGLLHNPLHTGGTHENGKRAGTSAVLQNVGLGHACLILGVHGQGENQRVAWLRNRLYESLVYGLGTDRVRLNGSAEHRLPGNLNVTFVGVCPSGLSEAVDPFVAVSAASACRKTGKARASHVLDAMGALDDGAVVRFGLGRFTTQQEVDAAAELFVREARRLYGIDCPV